MNKDFKPLSFFNIRKRAPYYIRCFNCCAEIYAYSPAEVEREAKGEGWVYDYINDIVLCGECKQPFQRQEEEWAKRKNK